MTKKELLAKCIDDLVNLDFNGRNVIDLLYKTALKRKKSPLSLQIASSLVDTVKEGDNVIFLTGFPEMPWIDKGIPETDGPVGTAILARALIYACKAIPIIVTEKHFAQAVQAALNGIGLSVFKVKEISLLQPGTPAVVIYPADDRIDGFKFCDEFKPSAIFAIEKPGKNEYGQYHHMSGYNISHCLENIEDIFLAAQKNLIPTFAIGDGGNEVGMGELQDITKEIVPAGKECGCGCGGGIAAVSKADFLMTATVVNWGATAITAVLSLITEKRNVLASPELELRSLESCVSAGAVDGFHNEAIPSVDGIAKSYYNNLISLIKCIINQYFEGE